MSTSTVPDLASLSIREYIAVLSSDHPSPGGGSAAALTGAIGASLVQMTCGINFKRAKNLNKELSAANAQKADRIKRELLKLVTLDALVYEKLSVHWKNKSPELQGLLKEACKVPVDIAKLTLEGMGLAVSEKDSTSALLISDLIEASNLLFAAFRSAGLHVDINLKSIEDAAFVGAVRSEWSASVAEARRLHAPFKGEGE